MRSLVVAPADIGSDGVGANDDVHDFDLDALAAENVRRRNAAAEAEVDELVVDVDGAEPMFADVEDIWNSLQEDLCP